jgi:hypothetical protein
VLGVEVLGLLVVAVGVPVVVARSVYRLIRVVSVAGVGAVAVVVLRLIGRRDQAPLGVVSGIRDEPTVDRGPFPG